jgi:hypothetical protein
LMRSGTRGDQLFWSGRGEIACGFHAPAESADRWRAEAWTLAPRGAGHHGLAYHCQRCGTDDAGTFAERQCATHGSISPLSIRGSRNRLPCSGGE